MGLDSMLQPVMMPYSRKNVQNELPTAAMTDIMIQECVPKGRFLPHAMRRPGSPAAEKHHGRLMRREFQIDNKKNILQ
ncbi:hypothetical protein [Desulfococcus sp.]|uniref:hypothetical protein n=1 Tax=Desulfococcus sp. TaxID=2025834 RepID=UPI0035935405